LLSTLVPIGLLFISISSSLTWVNDCDLRLKAVFLSVLFKLEKVCWHFTLTFVYPLLVLNLFLFNFPLSFLCVFGNQLDDLAVLLSKKVCRLKALALDHLLALFVDLLVS
jgi:hypothetical protein